MNRESKADLIRTVHLASLFLASVTVVSLSAQRPPVSRSVHNAQQTTAPADPAGAADGVVLRGWDTTYSLRRIAAPMPALSSIYFEDCPDAPGGKCFGSLPVGGGFYTLGGAGTECKVNSDDPWLTPGASGELRLQRCPYEFKWLTDGQGTPFRAGLTIDNRDWNGTTTKNLYIGIHQNVARPGEKQYLGGTNDMALSHARSTTALYGAWDRNGPDNPNATARYLVGVSWHTASVVKGISLVDIEMNVGNVGKHAGGANPKWLSRCPEKNGIARNDLEQTLHYIYLCGEDWGFPELVSGQTTLYSIYWPDIIVRLVDSGILDKRLVADDFRLTFIAGIEQLGRMRTEVVVSDWQLSNFTPARP